MTYNMAWHNSPWHMTWKYYIMASLHASMHCLFAAVQNNYKKWSQWYSTDACHDRYNVRMCYDSHMVSSWCVNLYISSFSSLLFSAVIAALWCFILYSWFLHLLFSTSSGVSLSLLSLYCSLLHRRHSPVSIQHRQWTPPIIQVTRAETVIYSDNWPWHKPLHIPNMASSRSSNVCHQLISDMNHYMHLYSKAV